MKSAKVNILKLSDPLYPDCLRHIYKPPAKLFFRGTPPSEWIDRPKVAIVGSRKASPYGKSVTEDIAQKLARAGVVIISGLAYGIDSAAQKGALDGGGLTVSVLATPVNRIYPASHGQLAQAILSDGGTIISECGEGENVYKNSFLERNRIISGLADVIIITEAASRSGSLNTARNGLEQGKAVMAVPGNITSPTSVGCNNLIKAGALPLTEVEDVFYALGIKGQTLSKDIHFSGTEEEETVLQLIKAGVVSQEEIATSSGLESAVINNALTMLEIAGVIKPKGGGVWTLA